MFARSTTITGKPEAVDAGIALVSDEIMPAVERMPGYVGLSMLVDRDTGGCVVTSAWQNERAMHATELQVAPLRDRLQRLFGTRPQVREWEIAVLHRVRRSGEGACARVTWSRVEPARLDEQLYLFQIGVLPQIEDLPGFCSASLFVDRRSGTAALAATYESRQALAFSRDAASDLRDDSSRRMGAEIIDVAEFEVALAHLRVPETV